MAKWNEVEGIDLLSLKSPPKPFKVFVPKDNNDLEFFNKIAKLKKYLMEKYLYISDEYRDPRVVSSMLNDHFYSGKINIFYEMGNFGGIMGFTDTLPGFKCTLMFKIWDKKLWSNGFVKSCRELLRLYFDTMRLKRISSSTPDDKIVRMSKMVGFNVEGTLKKGFIWKNNFMDLYLLGYTKEG